MTILLINAALEKKLAALSPQLPAAFENEAFEPTPGAPYQRATLIPNTPIDHAINFDVTEWRGLYHVLLCYPPGEGRGAAQARAKALADHFQPFQALAEAGLEVQLYATARVGSGFGADERWCVPVTVPWRAKLT